MRWGIEKHFSVFNHRTDADDAFGAKREQCRGSLCSQASAHDTASHHRRYTIRSYCDNCPGGEIGRRRGLENNLSPLEEILEVKPVKFGEGPELRRSS